jgi:hypothetical protein
VLLGLLVEAFVPAAPVILGLDDLLNAAAAADAVAWISSRRRGRRFLLHDAERCVVGNGGVDEEVQDLAGGIEILARGEQCLLRRRFG